MKNAGQLHGSLTVTNRFWELSFVRQKGKQTCNGSGRQTLEK